MDGMAGAGGTGGMWAMTGPMWMPSAPPTLGRVLGIHPQPVPVVPLLGLLALIGYVAGLLLLRRRGEPWPLPRTLAWVAGIVVLELVTATGIEGYGMMIFSIHMVQHMALAMVVPILLALGAPYRLALLIGTPAVRRVLAWAPSTGVATVLLSAPVRWLLFLAPLYGIYFTPLFGTLMHSVWGHNLMLLHFLATGALFFGPLVSGARASAHRRLAESFASAPLHAVFGLVVLLATHPVVHFFDDPDPRWGIGAVGDQSLAGGIAWISSETATVLVMAVIAGQSLARRRLGAAGYLAAPDLAVIPASAAARAR